MRNRDISLKEYVIEQTKSTGILPCIKLHKKDDYLAYAQAMYDGGARVIEVTMTTPGVRGLKGETMKSILRKTLSVTGKALGVGLIVADVALNVVGVILCAVTSQD